MSNALNTGHILMPKAGVDLAKWAVVACDQYTAQPDYWQSVEALVGDRPSTLRLTLPEVWLDQADRRIPAIHQAMRDYLAAGLLTTAVRDGFVLLKRQTPSGVRPGLMVCLDLDCYDFTPGARSLIRPTEGTVLSRVPPRAAIRRGAALELPHVMMLLDDPGCTVIEPLMDRTNELRPLYDFELMQGGGHLQGWAVEGEDVQRVQTAIDTLADRCGGLLYAVGDGNHSLAAAKQCWLEFSQTLSHEERLSHPARWALVELVNLCCPGLKFEPIHRVIFNVDPSKLMSECAEYLRSQGLEVGEGDDLIAFDLTHTWRFKSSEHPLRPLQCFLDHYLAAHLDARIDYIHGAEALKALIGRPDTLGFMPRAFDKSELFSHIRRYGVLPRKTFSMGEAWEKRYYLEARRIEE